MLHAGSCHCGKIAFEVEGDFTEGLECNCSICRRRGTILAFVSADDFKLTTPKSDLSTYTFNTHKLKHHFCDTCGVATHSDGINKDGSATRAVNLRCVADVDLSALKINKWDGASA